ncbi:MAG: hypothetical protein MPW15_00535 [Candidatus Manganitrophus sp.]|nr:hypothetical protein [Candidatus Manganitrophus sp.]
MTQISPLYDILIDPSIRSIGMVDRPEGLSPLRRCKSESGFLNRTR